MIDVPIMSTIISRNTQAASIMIGEKGAAIVWGLSIPNIDVDAGSFSGVTGPSPVDPRTCLSPGLRLAELGAGDDLVLQVCVQFREIGTVAGHSHHE